MRGGKALHACLALLLGLQLAYWWHARPFKPDLSIVPNVPDVEAVRVLSLGDEHAYFRLLALMLQNSGDTFGRFTPLKHYDMQKLSRWFYLLDTLDARSNMLPAMAAYYFSQTQNTPDVKYLVDYLYDHSIRDVKKKWWWLLQAMYLAQHKLNDMDLTLKIASNLLDEDVPAWAQQMLAVVHEKRGEMEAAYDIMMTIKEHAKNFTDADLKYMTYFVEERIKKLDAMKTPPAE